MSFSDEQPAEQQLSLSWQKSIILLSQKLFSVPGFLQESIVQIIPSLHSPLEEQATPPVIAPPVMPPWNLLTKTPTVIIITKITAMVKADLIL